ncbi:MAG: amidohydrolase [Rectinemataceae bacterium]|jgi:5-methylthioadenosine/S-adenosylhomocysteine deaminase
MGILIRGALLDGERRDILVEDGIIAKIAASIEAPAGIETIDARGMAALPSLVNAHAHSGMTLLRGRAEDLELDEWLNKAIWPCEAELTEDDVYWGTRLAALEMIKSGTTLCHDMYRNPRAQARAARDSGMRFVVNYPLVDGMDDAVGAVQRRACMEFFDDLPDCGPLVSFNLAAHSVYSTSEGSLRWLAEFSRDRGLSRHIHLAETEDEIRRCKECRGMSPAAYLDSLGFLGPDLFAAHAIWLDESDFDLLGARGVALVHNPVSNMKLASGPAYDYEAARRRGIRTLLGTDGSASNNGLDLFADMKIAALLQKQHYRDPRRMPVDELFAAATTIGHEAFGTGAGLVAAGRAADILLIDLSRPGMIPLHDLKSNLVYAGGGAAVDTVICAGRVIMRSGRVDGEEEVRAAASRCARDLAARCESKG